MQNTKEMLIEEAIKEISGNYLFCSLLFVWLLIKPIRLLSYSLFPSIAPAFNATFFINCFAIIIFNLVLVFFFFFLYRKIYSHIAQKTEISCNEHSHPRKATNKEMQVTMSIAKTLYYVAFIIAGGNTLLDLINEVFQIFDPLGLFDAFIVFSDAIGIICLILVLVFNYRFYTLVREKSVD